MGQFLSRLFLFGARANGRRKNALMSQTQSFTLTEHFVTLENLVLMRDEMVHLRGDLPRRRLHNYGLVRLEYFSPQTAGCLNENAPSAPPRTYRRAQPMLDSTIDLLPVSVPRLRRIADPIHVPKEMLVALGADGLPDATAIINNFYAPPPTDSVPVFKTRQEAAILTRRASAAAKLTTASSSTTK